ncbi:uncharacterized protein LOC133200547 [Saccostrea echinata]|uniref:uncharacterized protein LOC133200547 n=1 Tax=Saccostrea echinata TaxID=191078 RepID=UPI002A831375|nr:uncharacterized protein LOC133200547 [Saccostrea echinata]
MAAKTIILFVVSVLVTRLDAQDNIRCDMSDRYGSCDSGFCCVRDQFLASYVYCKRIPTNTHHCMTVVSESECACSSNLTCVPNINLPTFTSVYGKCQGDSSTDIPDSTMPTDAIHKPTKSHR